MARRPGQTTIKDVAAAVSSESKAAYLQGMEVILEMLDSYRAEATLATVRPAIRTFVNACKDVAQIGEPADRCIAEAPPWYPLNGIWHKSVGRGIGALHRSHPHGFDRAGRMVALCTPDRIILDGNDPHRKPVVGHAFCKACLHFASRNHAPPKRS